MRTLLSSASVALLLLVAGCSSPRDHVPEIRRLYGEASKRHVRNPVVVVHGILGARLEHRETKQTVWGAFTSGSADPTTREGAVRLSVPFEDLLAARAPDLARASVFATGPLEAIKLGLLFAVINVGVYRDILKTLGVGGYRDPVGVDPGSPQYNLDHFTCFTFFYDWRRDNSVNAAEFARFLKNTRARIDRGARRRVAALRAAGSAAEREEADELEAWLEAGYRFDVVAHSMGGLVTRYFLRYGDAPLPADGSVPEVTWAGAREIDRVVLVGTPSLGSMDAFQNLVKGFSPGPPILPVYPPAILGTMTSIYQLLPRGEGLVIDEAGAPMDVDLFDVDVWERNDWGLFAPDADRFLQWFLPGVADRGARRAMAREAVANVLARTRRFHRALDRPAPDCPVEMRLFAADTEPTIARVRMRARDGKLVPSFDGADLYAPGDATVTRRSALADLRPKMASQAWLQSAVPWSGVTFLPDDHIGLTKNPIFTDNVLFHLLQQPPRRR
ncbi:MAG: lipase/acyltransferase domain-containing protein [Planctomycetota bacterium]